jgi:hypothetical protein
VRPAGFEPARTALERRLASSGRERVELQRWSRTNLVRRFPTLQSCSSESNRVLGCTGPARHHLRLSSTFAVVAFGWNVRTRALPSPAPASNFDGEPTAATTSWH